LAKYRDFTNNRVLGDNAFHEKAGRSQVGFLVFLWTWFLSSRVAATVATLPSALLVSDFVSLGASWVFSFQPVLPPDYRPPVPFFRNGSWARRLTQSPELGVWAFAFPSSKMFCLYAAAGIAV
jgi:hypothetical protein